ncbi:MAG: type III-A CRISPR-associated RAMP protein Csm3 [Anaerolineae bacterium]|nr:type III-A CRISPR-associated RAMP protein Csm3 [Anaerolineae bacterium]MCI0609632.1 type III-A CRISPR-associated RAMP protein Csm3 [Anaerolineae bacterium]
MIDQNVSRLHGRILIEGSIRAVTGLHIGKGKGGIMIGGIDNAVIRDTVTDKPYIPGSSLKGKLRSLAEKSAGKKKNFPRDSRVQIHVCERAADYKDCQVCRIYGVPGQMESSAPTHLIVRDIFLHGESADRLKDMETELPFTEIKYEASIDRITSEANPRPLERVPADSVFGPFEMIFSIYDQRDFTLLVNLFEALRLLEDDYLGGSGSRGSGKVKFEGITVTLKPVTAYSSAAPVLESFHATDVDDLRGKETDIIAKANEVIQ